MCVIIMTTLSGIAIPRYASSLAVQRGNATAHRVSTDIARAQRLAKFSSTSQTLRFTTQQDSYQILGMKDIDRPSLTYTVKLAETPYSARITSASFGGDSDLVFNGFGIPDSGGTVVIRVGSYTKTITTEANTGKVTIQ